MTADLHPISAQGHRVTVTGTDTRTWCGITMSVRFSHTGKVEHADDHVFMLRTDTGERLVFATLAPLTITPAPTRP